MASNVVQKIQSDNEFERMEVFQNVATQLSKY